MNDLYFPVVYYSSTKNTIHQVLKQHSTLLINLQQLIYFNTPIMPARISVIICCFNSATRITPTLEHLAKQKNIPLSNWEVILVDNSSTDNTAVKAQSVWNSFEAEKPSFRIVSELTPGLSAARKKGITASLFEYVLFCDDDNWLDENYLNIALRIMQLNPQIGALGGTGYPVFEGEEPPYFWVNQFHALAVGNQSKIDGDITDERGVLYGAGMVLNKAAYGELKEKYQFNFILTGRIGNNLVSSEDHELCLALKKIGYRIFYSQSLKFQHYIPKNRTTIDYYKKLFFGFGKSYASLHVYRVNSKNLHSLKKNYKYICLRSIKNIISTLIILFLKGYPFKKNKYQYLAELHRLYNNIGILNIFARDKNLFKKQYSNNILFSKNS